MHEYFQGTAIWVHLATLSYVLGFFITRQMVLRVLILAGTVFYIVYYFVHLGEPQWAAIVGSLLILAANLTGLARLLWYRLPIGLRGEDRDVFEAIGGGMQPGEFRKLVRLAERRTTTGPTMLTREGAAPGLLYFVLDGHPTLIKDRRQFRLDPGCFVGEVGFKLDGIATATVEMPDGGAWLAWESTALQKLLDGEPSLARAFDAAITRDMARKIANSAPSSANALPDDDGALRPVPA